MNSEIYDAIYRAKVEGLSDTDIMSRFSVGLRDIEQAIIKKMGVNLNLFSAPKPKGLQPKNFELETTTVWSFKSRGKWATHSGNYRGNWSPYIPRNVILRYSKPGDIVLDQFCGGGTTAIEAKLLGRRCIARDINPNAVILARRNLNFEIDSQSKGTSSFEPKIEVGDAKNLEGIPNESIDLICTHPPYANIVQYTGGIEGDLSFCDIPEFIDDMKQVAKECYRVLKEEGHVAILIGDTRRKKRVVPLGFQTIEAFLNQGFYLKDLVIKRQHNCRTTGFWYTQSIKYNFLLLSHEYLAIFTKIPPLNVQQQLEQKVPTLYQIKKTPKLPDKMECKTTWIFPKEYITKLVEQNLTNRYRSSQTLVINLGTEYRRLDLQRIQKRFGLVIVRTDNVKCKDQGCLKKLLYNLEYLFKDVVSLLVPGGHLVIQTQDVRIEQHTISPVISIWKIPQKSFRIREIIVVTDESSRRTSMKQPFSITHRYLLVFTTEKNT